MNIGKNDMEQLRIDIEARDASRKHAARDVRASGTRVVLQKDAMPVQVALGTVTVVSHADSVVKFYTYFNEWFRRETAVEFVHLERLDRAFFATWNDYTIYERESYERTLLKLQGCGFEIYV